MVKPKLYQSHLPTHSDAHQKPSRKFVVRGQSQSLESKQSGHPNSLRVKVAQFSSIQKPQKQDVKLLNSGSEGRFWRLCLLWLIASLSLLGSGLISILWLLKPPPLDCQNLSLLVSDGERLYCLGQITTLDNPDSLVTALNVVAPWNSSHPLYSEAQRLMQDWSQGLLSSAQEEIQQGDLKRAVYLANQIPVNSPLYPEAQVAIATWLQEWQLHQHP